MKYLCVAVISFVFIFSQLKILKLEMQNKRLDELVTLSQKTCSMRKEVYEKAYKTYRYQQQKIHFQNRSLLAMRREAIKAPSDKSKKLIAELMHERMLNFQYLRLGIKTSNQKQSQRNLTTKNMKKN